ncbi:twin-arginine translocase subunit TatB [Elioraea sp. Yellowstone]|jgi:sec-independent protein translocase protein TatB|uniref:Sec-independent protein translocase protein TatB n=1 Tax=Elioraea sp. Yellowstone TaxID=2592070 RepID=UPI001151A691|nr:Sec-independent protein translocase protein TatB [Elioraea sp. Yellowstone]TQF77066.1 twin-arginine translocase subunit TatB [Elioraea sp. Yellowstone]
MLDLAWTEIALILLVALVVIGPKDLPHAIKGIAEFIRKARRMAGEFQVHVDEMMRETKLDEVKRQIDEVRQGAYEMKRQFEDEIDRDRDIARSFSDPFADSPTGTTGSPPPAATPAPAALAPAPAAVAPPDPARPAEDDPPAFVPPGTAKRDTA